LTRLRRILYNGSSPKVQEKSEDEIYAESRIRDSPLRFKNLEKIENHETRSISDSSSSQTGEPAPEI